MLKIYFSKYQTFRNSKYNIKDEQKKSFDTQVC